MIKAAIFDMDGVIIDSEPDHLKLEKGIFKKLGIEVSQKEHQSFVGTTSYYMWETLKNNYKLPQSVEELVKNNRSAYLEYLIESAKKNEIIYIDGVVNFIKDLHKNNIKLAIASSSPMDVIEIVIKSIKLDNCFDMLVTGDSVKKSKPEPDIFLYAAKKLGVSPLECFVVEDSENGVKAAKAAGMKCIGYKNNNSGNQDLSYADIVIKSFQNVTYYEITKMFDK